MPAHRVLSLLAFPLLVLACPAFAQTTLTGRVVAVQDGDTITVLTPQRRQVRVQLHGVDAPELRQPFGAQARRFTSQLVLGRTVKVVVRGRDGDGRTLGKVFLPGRTEETVPDSRPEPLPNRPIDPTGAQSDLPRGIPGEREAIPPPSATRAGALAADAVTRDLDRELVQAGLARWHRGRAPRDRTLAALERQARAARRGLWAKP